MSFYIFIHKTLDSNSEQLFKNINYITYTYAIFLICYESYV